MSTPLSPLPGRDRLDCSASPQANRRRFLFLALTSTATLVGLAGCETPTFDPETTTLCFSAACNVRRP